MKNILKKISIIFGCLGLVSLFSVPCFLALGSKEEICETSALAYIPDEITAIPADEVFINKDFYYFDNSFADDLGCGASITLQFSFDCSSSNTEPLNLSNVIVNDLIIFDVNNNIIIFNDLYIDDFDFTYSFNQPRFDFEKFNATADFSINFFYEDGVIYDFSLFISFDYNHWITATFDSYSIDGYEDDYYMSPNNTLLYGNGTFEGQSIRYLVFGTSDFDYLYVNGYFYGYDAGYENGLDVGYENGYDEGFESGGYTEDDITDAYDDGYSTGYDEGYDYGYDDGVDSLSTTIENLTSSNTALNNLVTEYYNLYVEEHLKYENLIVESDNAAQRIEDLKNQLASAMAITNTFSLISSSFTGLIPLLDLELAPNITIGMLLTIPFTVSIIVLAFKMLG